MYLYAGFMRKDTLTPDPISAMKGLHRSRNRLDELRRAVRYVHQQARTDIQNNHYAAGNYLTVFLAPEYFFARDCEHQNRFIEKGEKQDIVRGLANLSRECPGTLIVPGTVPWWRPLYQGLRKHSQSNQNRKTKVDNRVQAADQLYNNLGYISPLYKGWSVATPTDNQALNSRGGVDNTNDVQMIQDLLDHRSLHAYIAQNTAYIAYEGQVIKYHKMGSYKEVHGETEHNVIYAAGNQQGLFSVGPLRFGLEICLDHCIGMLGTAGQTVHVQLVIAASVAYAAGNVHLNNGGVFLHADSSQILPKGDPDRVGRHVRLTGHATKTRLGNQGDVHLFKITLDNNELGINPAPGMALNPLALGTSNPPPVTLKTRAKRVIDRIRS
jgi:predicted amidohydrolase